MKMRYPIAITIISVLLFVGNLGLADKDRPQLLTRTFDNNYIVKYLGMNFYAGYNAYQTHKESATRASASSSDMGIRTAIRMGAKKVTIISNETIDKMPANQFEYDFAVKEGDRKSVV